MPTSCAITCRRPRFALAAIKAGNAVDRELLLSALGNLLQNAFKFTCCHTQVVLKTFAAGDRVLIEVEDSCGGLPAGGIEEMFRPFTQNGHDKSGVGLGLVICRRSVEANGGGRSVDRIWHDSRRTVILLRTFQPTKLASSAFSLGRVLRFVR